MNHSGESSDIGHLGSVHISEIEPLYWMVEDAIYDGNTQKAKTVFELLCYIADHKKSFIHHGLKKRQIERLKEIAYEIYDEETYVKKRSIEFKFPIQSKPLPFKNEKELEIYLSSHLQILNDAFQDNVRLVGTQVKTDFEYACDIVVESDRIFYPVELKIGQSTHSVVSQIDKYCTYFYRKLRYSHYKPIQGVVIANGSDAYSINEIRRSSHWLFDVQASNNVVLVRI